MGMYDVNWFTDGKRTFIEKCLVDDENFDQIGKDNSMSQRKHAITARIRDHTTSHQNIRTMVSSIGTEKWVYL